MSYFGLKYPVNTGIDGGSEVITDSEQLKKLLVLAFSEGDDDNPFQNLGFDKGILFQAKTNNLQGPLFNTVRDIVKLFDGRIELTQSEPITINNTMEGELEMTIRWIDTSTGDEEETNLVFKR